MKQDWTMVKTSINLSAVIILLVGLSLRISALPIADADADAGPLAVAEAEPEAKPDIIPGRIQNNPVLLIYDLLASLVASIPILGVPLVEILGLGRR